MTVSLSSEFRPDDAAIILVDHQSLVATWVNSQPRDVMARNAGMWANLAVEMQIPLVVTTTMEDSGHTGTTLQTIQQAAPKAFAARVRRGGTMDAFADLAFEKAVAATTRRHLVIAGLITDVCVYRTVRSALAKLYRVAVVADACGTTSVLADEVSFANFRELGARVVTTMQMVSELYPDFQTEAGKRAQRVASSAMMVEAA